MGLSVLPSKGYILSDRKRMVTYYDSNLDFSMLNKMKTREEAEWNYCYYAVIFNSEEELLAV